MSQDDPLLEVYKLREMVDQLAQVCTENSVSIASLQSDVARNFEADRQTIAMLSETSRAVSVTSHSANFRSVFGLWMIGLLLLICPLALRVFLYGTVAESNAFLNTLLVGSGGIFGSTLVRGKNS